MSEAVSNTPIPKSRQNAAAAAPSVVGLRRIKLLASVAPQVLDDVARQCRWRRYLPGQRVISREATDNDVYLITSGCVRIIAFSGGGRQVTYRDVGAGDWFGDLAAIDGLSRSADVEALEESLLASMSPAFFKELIHAHPEVCDCVLARLASVVRDLSERILEFSTLGVPARVRAELLRLAREAGIRDNAARLEPAPKHAELASRVSTYREQVTRELSGMVSQGLLQRSGRALVVPDVARLERAVAEARRSL